MVRRSSRLTALETEVICLSTKQVPPKQQNCRAPINMPWGPLSKHITQARKITFSSGLTGEKAIQISNRSSTLMLRLIKTWAGAHPDHSVTGVRDVSILLVHFWSLLSLARETMVSRLSPAYFPGDLLGMDPGQVPTPGRDQGVPWWWGQGAEGERPCGLGRWMGCWQKERKASPQADSLESLMIPRLICIGHPAVLLWFYPCHVYWDRKVKLCIVMAVGWLWEFSWRGCSDRAEHFQYNIGRTINKFLTKYLQDPSTPFNQYESKTEFCFLFNRNSPGNWLL